ncbi:hypothetical protein H8U31_001275 [Salmonella enterica]|nr:hypothetical protein [Salmonella enterica]EGC0267525.1 hypothetical protein [Salmonella enterica]
MKKIIFALAVVATSITSAHAGFAAAINCPQSGSVMVRGIGENVSVTEGNKEFTLGQPTMYENMGGKVATIQGALNEKNPSEFRAIMFFANYSQTQKVIYVRSDRKNNETCQISDYQEFEG